MAKIVLLVEQNPKELEALAQAMASYGELYESHFALGADKALAWLQDSACDVVVCGAAVEDKGVPLLDTVMRRWPSPLRILVSGPAERRLALKAMPAAHQILAKPVRGGAVTAAIERGCALRTLLMDARLRSLVSGMSALPARPDLFSAVVEEMEDENASLQRLGRLIEQDLGMTAKVLQLVNSAFFGMPRRMDNVPQAASLLGLDTLRAIFVVTQVLAQFESMQEAGINLESAGQHAMLVGSLAKAIAAAEGLGPQAENDALMAGVLHDMGKLVLAANLPSRYRQVVREAQEGRRLLHALETEAFGFTHAHVGAYMLSLWGLPGSVVGAVAFHHAPTGFMAKSLGPASILHAADALSNQIHPLPGLPGGAVAPNPGLLEALGGEAKYAAWAGLASVLPDED